MAKAEQNGVCIEGAPGGAYVKVTFPERPSNEILAALRAAEFVWRGGGWMGQRARIPAEVLELVKESAR